MPVCKYQAVDSKLDWLQYVYTIIINDRLDQSFRMCSLPWIIHDYTNLKVFQSATHSSNLVFMVTLLGSKVGLQIPKGQHSKAL